MQTKYRRNNLYTCTINDMIPYYTENICGYIALTGENKGDYETIVYKLNNKFIDINNPKRVINIFDSNSKNMPIISKNYHLYTLNTETLRKYETEKSLVRVLSTTR